ncbi:hypothetical protein [Nocardia salmonicida]|uniref:hypothetical protein n=1 Tax=Nocardia salmonicida TaxID=53431 RepID=UPI0033F9B3C3
MTNPYFPNTPDDPDELSRRAAELASMLEYTPPGDHGVVARHLANGTVLYVAGALADVKMMVEVHHDMAPVSAKRVQTVAQHLANEVIKFIEGWPK